MKKNKAKKHKILTMTEIFGGAKQSVEDHIDVEKYYIVDILHEEVIDLRGPYKTLEEAKEKIKEFPKNYLIMYGAALKWRLARKNN